ncbi:MAG: hypothetical protein ACI8ZB_004265 [Desulforhopalus sp.]|jgi:hypothetical protein
MSVLQSCGCGCGVAPKAIFSCSGAVDELTDQVAGVVMYRTKEQADKS